MNVALESRVAERTTQLERANSQLEGALQERAGALLQEHQARVEAQNALQLREEDLSLASHELKTPLTSLPLQLHLLEGLLRDEGLSNDTRQRLRSLLEKNSRQIRRLSRLNDDLMGAATIADGPLTLDFQPTDLGDVVQQVVEHFLASSANGGAIVLRRAGPVQGQWDVVCLGQAVANILSNAVKFGEGHPIDVSVDHVDGEGQIVICDRGRGIPPDDQVRIFDRFERPVPAQHFGGLGLYLARQIVQAHGGTIELRSSPGYGATFTMRLPLVSAARTNTDRVLPVQGTGH